MGIIDGMIAGAVESGAGTLSEGLNLIAEDKRKTLRAKAEELRKSSISDLKYKRDVERDKTKVAATVKENKRQEGVKSLAATTLEDQKQKGRMELQGDKPKKAPTTRRNAKTGNYDEFDAVAGEFTDSGVPYPKAGGAEKAITPTQKSNAMGKISKFFKDQKALMSEEMSEEDLDYLNSLKRIVGDAEWTKIIKTVPGEAGRKFLGMEFGGTDPSEEVTYGPKSGIVDQAIGAKPLTKEAFNSAKMQSGGDKEKARQILRDQGYKI